MGGNTTEFERWKLLLNDSYLTSKWCASFYTTALHRKYVNFKWWGFSNSVHCCVTGNAKRTSWMIYGTRSNNYKVLSSVSLTKVVKESETSAFKQFNFVHINTKVNLGSIHDDWRKPDNSHLLWRIWPPKEISLFYIITYFFMNAYYSKNKQKCKIVEVIFTQRICTFLLQTFIMRIQFCFYANEQDWMNLWIFCRAILLPWNKLHSFTYINTC